MLTISYSDGLGGHTAKAASTDSAWCSLAKRRKGSRAYARVNSYAADNSSATYEVTVIRRSGEVIAKGFAYVRGQASA